MQPFHPMHDDRPEQYPLQAPEAVCPPPPADAHEPVGPAMTQHPGVLVDMNMAEQGSTAAQAGIHTPIASWLGTSITDQQHYALFIACGTELT